MTDRLEPTPGQTIGPFFGYALPYPAGPHLVPAGHPDAVRLHGLVSDGAAQPVPDALIEVWQADPAGNIVHTPGSLARSGWDFTGWGRAATDNAGRYQFSTLRPGGPHPFFALTVCARGLLDRLYTRAYLDPADTLPEPARSQLVARPDPSGFRFDITLQGPGQTPFLAIGSR